MDIMEIVLLAAGGIVFILSFLIPMKKEESSEESRGLVKEEIKTLVSEELEAVRGHVDDVVEEAVTYSIEKTERSLERLSNEKIMAVSEYSDTVLAEIHKNHEEVMFLYDMLNDKHINLKNTVSEVNRTVKEVKETKKEAEEVVNTFQRLAPEAVIPLNVAAPAMQPQRFATASQEPIPPVVMPELALTQGTMMQQPVTEPQMSMAQPVIEPQMSMAQLVTEPQMSMAQPVTESRISMLQPVAEPQTSMVPPVFAAAPVPVAVQASEVQKVSLASRKTAPAPQKVSMASRSVLPAAQKVAAAPRQMSPAPQQIATAPQQSSPIPQQITVASQRMVSAPQQIPSVSQKVSPMPQKVSPVSRSASPTPQKVTFPAIQREEAVQVPVTPPRPEQVQGFKTQQSSGVVSFAQETDVQGRNYNDRVLELYKNGKSNVAIARELNLGVGEVKLVIDLYKNRSEK